MNKQSLKLVLFFIIGMLTAFLVMYFVSDFRSNKEVSSQNPKQKELSTQKSTSQTQNTTLSTETREIDDLTAEKLVIEYVKLNKKLPDYYVTKSEARKQGWIAAQANLCKVLPGKAIGGDRFSNREKILPSGNTYFEADVNYNCGRRNADRIVYTGNGEVWLTHDHYKTFEKQ